ncbi:MAG: DUF2892 domain-containing protein [Silicimonas sp.]|nr:DUF2892 domain-containing protein [Silicimonas sp.]
MTANLGTWDRLLRLIVGVVLLFSPLLNIPAIWSGGIWAYVSMAVGLILTATALLTFCPIYRVFGISTCKL